VKGWATEECSDGLRIARRGRVRMDLAHTVTMPAAPISRRRLAHQIRQDTWRALQQERGFSPVITVALDETSLTITAGGQLPHRPSAATKARLAAVLDDPANRRRWLTHARRP